MKVKCPMCGYHKVETDTTYENGYLVEYFIKCPKCKFFELWAYGGLQFNKPIKWRYYFKFRKYTRRRINNNE